MFAAVKKAHPNYDRKLCTIERALTNLVNAGALESKRPFGYRLPQE